MAFVLSYNLFCCVVTCDQICHNAPHNVHTVAFFVNSIYDNDTKDDSIPEIVTEPVATADEVKFCSLRDKCDL